MNIERNLYKYIHSGQLRSVGERGILMLNKMKSVMRNYTNEKLVIASEMITSTDCNREITLRVPKEISSRFHAFDDEKRYAHKNDIIVCEEQSPIKVTLYSNDNEFFKDTATVTWTLYYGGILVTIDHRDSMKSWGRAIEIIQIPEYKIREAVK